MNWLAKLKARFTSKREPEHLSRGKLGERAAKKHLQRQGMKFLTGNFRFPFKCDIIRIVGYQGVHIDKIYIQF